MIRFDGRNENEIRAITCELGIIKEAAGSAKLTFGSTYAIARVYGPSQPKFSRLENYEKCVIDVHYSVAGSSISSHSSSMTELNQIIVRNDKKRGDYIKNVLENSIDLKSFPRSVIIAEITIFNDDGSNLSTSVNAVILALLDSGIPMLSTPVSATLLWNPFDQKIYVDPTLEEEEEGGGRRFDNSNSKRNYNKLSLFTLTYSNFHNSDTFENNPKLVASDCLGVFSIDIFDKTILLGAKTANIILNFFRDVIADKTSMS